MNIKEILVTKPEHCALALAIPLNREDFFIQLDPNTNKDFVKSLNRKYCKLKKDFLWKEIYEPTAKKVTEIAQKVKEKGVTVAINATLEDVEKLFKTFSVVTLVAHWRSSKFYPSDFIAPDRLIEILKKKSNPLTPKISNIFSHKCIDNIQKLKYIPNEVETINQILAKNFNNIINKDELFSASAKNQMNQLEPYDKDYRIYLNRLIIDDHFRDIIYPGNRIEFFDGFHSINNVAKAIPKNYEGIIDFTVCNSVLIGNIVKRHRRCIVLVNEKPTSLLFRMLFYKGVIELLFRIEINYIKAVAEIRKNILKSNIF